MTVKEIRSKAAKLLESRPDSWCQGKFRRHLPGGGYAYCIIGACREVSGYYAARSTGVCAGDIVWFADLAAGQAAGVPISPDAAAVWNDAPGRTREEVIAALKGRKVRKVKP